MLSIRQPYSPHKKKLIQEVLYIVSKDSEEI